MKIVDRLCYRWKYECDPLPGESEPTREGVRVIVWTMPNDREKSLFLRKLRALLFGYGQGWTFFEALINVVFNV